MNLNSPTFIGIHSTYSTVSVGLFTNTTLVDSISMDHKKACVSLINNLDVILKKNALTIKDLDFIAVNQGPGPYTTLRITLTLADGLAFATGIPLVGVDGFKAFIQEINTPNYDYIAIVFNAFCKEVYYALYNIKTDNFDAGYLPLNEYIEKLNALGKKRVLIAGNGVTLFAQDLTKVTVPELHKTADLLESASLQAIGITACSLWQTGKAGSNHLLPLYLKRPAYHMIATSPSQP